MKVLITGAFGYLGYSVVGQCLESEEVDELVLYDNHQSRNSNFFHIGGLANDSKITAIYFNDILDDKALKKSLEEIDAVIHLAGKASTPFSDSQAHSFDQINNWGTANLVDKVEQASSVKRFIYLSTVSVYGNTRGEEVDETYPPNPHSFYGISKLKGEKHVERLNNGIEKIILRSGNVYGYNPCFRTDAVINRFAFDAHFKKKILIQGSGEQKRAFVSVENLGKQVVGSLTEPRVSREIINVVDMNASIAEVAEAVFEVWPGTEYVHSINHMKMRSVAVGGVEKDLGRLIKEMKRFNEIFRTKKIFPVSNKVSKKKLYNILSKIDGNGHFCFTVLQSLFWVFKSPLLEKSAFRLTLC